MLIVGAGGLATQLFEDLIAINLPDVVFWSEAELKYGFIADQYTVIRTDEAVINYFNTLSKAFILCVGGKVESRKQLRERFEKLGGTLTSFISPFSRISPYGTQFGEGTIILNQVNVEPGVILGEACLLNKTSNVGHGCNISAYCEIGPGVILTGEVEVGKHSFIGTGAIIHPKVKIGSNVTVAAGAVVTKNIPDNAVVAGVPAQIKYIKKNEAEHLHDHLQS